MGLILDIALTHLRGRTRQTIVSIAGVSTGVAFSIAMAALMQGSQLDFVRKIIDTSPHVVVTDEFRSAPVQPVQRLFTGGAVSLRGVRPREELRGIKQARERVARLSALPETVVSPVLRGQVVVRYGGRDVAASVLGIEPEAERLVSRIDDDMVEGELNALYSAANGLIVGAGVARRLGARLGATLSVSSPAGVLMNMKLVGIFHTGVVAKDDSAAYALLKKVQVLQDRPNVINEIRLRVADVNNAHVLARRIESRFGYRAESWDEANEGILEAFEIRNTIMYTVVGAILVVAGFGIFNIVSTITYEKARDIAILKSLGFYEGDIRTIFLLEGLALGLAGSVLGGLFGYALCRVMGTIEFHIKWATEVTSLPLHYSPWHYLIAAVLAMAAAGIAGYLPARRAARLDPVEIIRGAA